MNIKRCGFKVFGGEIFPRVQHKLNTKATLCNLPYIRKNLETIMVSRFSLVENSGKISPPKTLKPQRFMFIGTQCNLWGKPDGTGHGK